MASDQAEYCGECKHYEHCIALANKGRLHRCIALAELEKGE